MKVITPLPHDCYLALSGGVDSMFGFHFLTRNPQRKVQPLFFHHGTATSETAFEFVTSLGIDITCGFAKTSILDDESLESYYRRERYDFFSNYQDKPIITCHHLDDQVETYLMGAMFGNPRLIPYKRGNFIRPFLNVKKSEIINYAKLHNVKYSQDETNNDVDIPRNRVRHNIIKEALKVNPGLYKSIGKLNECGKRKRI